MVIHKTRPDRVYRQGRVVSIRFPNQVEAKNAATYFRDLVTLADSAVIEFGDVTRAVADHVHDADRTSRDEAAFRARMEKQSMPSGVS